MRSHPRTRSYLLGLIFALLFLAFVIRSQIFVPQRRVAQPQPAQIPGLPPPFRAPNYVPIQPLEDDDVSEETTGWLNFWPFNSRSKKANKWINEKKLRQYRDSVVVRFNVSTVDDEAALRKVADRTFIDIDVWDFGPNYVDVRTTSDGLEQILKHVYQWRDVGHMIRIADVASAVAATFPSKRKGDSDLISVLEERSITGIVHSKQGHSSHLDVDNLFFKDYQPLSVIYTWMRLLDSMFSTRGLVHMFSIGKSYEGRDIMALRVGRRPEGPSTEPRKTILITGGLHAREWISISTVNYLAWSFITRDEQDAMVTKILEEFDVVFIPVVNPDGYEYTWNVDRLWRKSRQPTPMYMCSGFDLDHAFGYRWDSAEHSGEPCSQSYGGDKPFQAVEAAQLAQWAKNETEKNAKFIAFIDLHSYSQQVLWPYAFSCDAQVPNLENMQEVAMNIAKHMRLTNGEAYTVGSACEGAVASKFVKQDFWKRRFEAAGGEAVDYFFHDLQARYSYQIKLRDTGSYGFLLPSENIVPTGQEVFQAMRYLGDFLLGNNGIETFEAKPTTAADQQDMRTDENDKSVLVESALKAEKPIDDQNFDLRRRRRRV